MKSDFHITLSVVSHGDAGKIRSLLASLQKSELNLSQYQLILTDNLMNELPDFDLSAWGASHILRNRKPSGFAENHNRAFEFARGDYFAILNPDLIFEHATFEPLLKRLHANNADLIAPIIVDEYSMAQDSIRTLPSPFELIRRRLPGYVFNSPQPDRDGLIHPDWIAGMFWLMPAETYRKLGGMDKKFRLYLEDVDFCTRARLRGMKIMVDANVQVRHDAQRSSRKSVKYLFWHVQSAFKFFTSEVYFRALRLK